MRILLASNVYPPNFIGGAELVAHQQARALQERGHEVRVFAGESVSFGDHHAMKVDEFEDLLIYRVSMLPSDFDPSRVNFCHRKIESHFQEILDGFRPEVFHGHNLIGLSVALPRLARRAGSRTVLTVHDHWGFCFKNTLLKERGRLCWDIGSCHECLPTIDDGRCRGIPMRMDYLALMLREVEALTPPSRYLADAYVAAGFPEDRVHRISYGIDVERFQHLEKKDTDGLLRLSFVGALLPHKGVATLMEALGHLPADAPVQVNVVGEGDQMGHYRRILRRDGQAEKVRFWGRIDNRDIEKVYAETDVLVLPSVWPENQPVTITEAKACGIPSIVSHLGGMPELVEEGKSGMVFEAGDAVDLARCIEHFLDDPSRAKRYGETARKEMEPVTFDAQAARLVELYRSLLDDPPEIPQCKRIVVCSGETFDREFGRLLDQLPSSDGWRFVLDEWLDEDLASTGLMHWIADGQDGRPRAQGLAKLPRLAKISGETLSYEDLDQRRSLFYLDAEQALECIEMIASQEALRERLSSLHIPNVSASR